MKKLIDIKQYSESILHCPVFLMHYFEGKVVWESCFEENVGYKIWYPMVDTIRPGEMSSEVRGDQTMEALTEKNPKRQMGPQSVCKNSKLSKNSTMSVKRAHLIKYRVPLGPSQEMKFLGPGGDRSPGPSQFLQPWTLYSVTSLDTIKDVIVLTATWHYTKTL